MNVCPTSSGMLESEATFSFSEPTAHANECVSNLLRDASKWGYFQLFRIH